MEKRTAAASRRNVAGRSPSIARLQHLHNAIIAGMTVSKYVVNCHDGPGPRRAPQLTTCRRSTSGEADMSGGTIRRFTEVSYGGSL